MGAHRYRSLMPTTATTPDSPSRLMLLRPVLAIAAALGGYALLPVHVGSATAAAIVTSMVSVALFLWVLRRQARRIIRSDHPTLAAAEALALLVTMFVLSFALIYVALSASDPTSFNQPIDKVAGIYFSMTVLTTVGFGDILALSDLTRMTVVVQMIADLVLLAAVVRLILGIARWARSTPRDPAAGTPIH